MKPHTLFPIAALGLCFGAGFLPAQPAETRELSELPPALDAAQPDPTDGPVIKLALLLDTSNSMDGLINQARSRLWKVVNEVGKAEVDGVIPQLQVALFQYGNDRLSRDSEYVELRCPFTTDLDIVSEQLFSLSTDGGSEYCGAVIRESIQRLDWGQSQTGPILRMIVIAGNEPFNQGTQPYEESIATARGMDIRVNTIFCGNRQQGKKVLWADGAKRGKGYYASIDQDQKQPDIVTPFDETLEQLNEALNGTYLGYGAQGEAAAARQATQDAFNLSESLFGGLSRIRSKASSSYSTSHWDLVSAYENDEVKLSEIDEKDLPKSLRGKTTKEIEAKLKALSAQRMSIKTQIQETSDQRDAYVADALKASANSGEALDDALISALRDQADAAGFNFK